MPTECPLNVHCDIRTPDMHQLPPRTLLQAQDPGASHGKAAGDSTEPASITPTYPAPDTGPWSFTWESSRGQHRTCINYAHVPCSRHRTLKLHLGGHASTGVGVGGAEPSSPLKPRAEISWAPWTNISTGQTAPRSGGAPS